jgi:hypothetical protein
MSPSSLQKLAGAIWLLVGAGLMTRAVLGHLLLASRLNASMGAMITAVALGLVVGAAKGRFVLARTALRNVDRIKALPEPRRPWQLFHPAFYLLIGLMMGMGIGIRRFLISPESINGNLIYGGVLLGIGGALFVSSLAYFSPERFRKTPKVEAPAE